MKRKWLWVLLLTLGPGLVLGLGVIGYGLFLQPPRYPISEWNGKWREPKTRTYDFQSFRSIPSESGLTVIGETEPWPHKHPRANSFLQSIETFEGDVEVALKARFLRGRYLGCYLCYDPEHENGYWLATGHAVGEDPNQAYIKIVRNGVWEVMAQAPLDILADREYGLVFSRRGEKLVLAVDHRAVVEWTDGSFRRGHVMLRLHNTKVQITELSVRGTDIAAKFEPLEGWENERTVRTGIYRGRGLTPRSAFRLKSNFCPIR